MMNEINMMEVKAHAELMAVEGGTTELFTPPDWVKFGGAVAHEIWEDIKEGILSGSVKSIPDSPIYYTL